MNKLQRWISALLCACMLTSAVAFAQEAVSAEEAPIAVVSAAPEPQDDTIVATVNDEAITWAAIKAGYENLVNNYGSYYDMTVADNINLFRSVALENQIYEVLQLQQAKAHGVDQLTEDEYTAIIVESDEVWDEAIANYQAQNFALTEESTEEEKAAAQAAAEAYFLEAGYTQEILRAEYVRYDLIDRLNALVTQDVTVTDDEVEADYQAKVAEDKALYENDLDAYVAYNAYVDQMAMYSMMYGTASDMEYAWYKPAGFRAVKHILLSVDEDLMAAYKDLQSRLEEQMDAEASDLQDSEPAPEATETETTSEPTQEPVTQADADNAKADILASLSDKIDEINQKIADGVSFDELIEAYGSDPGMSTEPYQSSGYEVAQASTGYYPEFVDAVFSVANIGDVSAPYLTDVGVHIVKYIGDVPAGPIEMTDAQREAMHTSLLEAKKSDLFSARLEEWLAAANIVYTGVIPSITELEAQEADADEAAVGEEAVAPAEAEAVAEEVPAEEPEAEDTPTE